MIMRCAVSRVLTDLSAVQFVADITGQTVSTEDF